MLNSLKQYRVAKYLPSNIYERKINGQLIGYEVKIMIGNELIRKWFSSKKFTPQQNLVQAKICLNNIMKSMVKTI